MLIIEIRLRPLGDIREERLLSKMEIVNDGRGSRLLGNYTVTVFDEHGAEIGIGNITNHRRLWYGPWVLVEKAVKTIHGLRMSPLDERWWEQ